MFGHILRNHVLNDGVEDLLCEDIKNKLSFSRLFTQDTKGSSISTQFQTGVRFSSWLSTLKFMALMKIEGQRVPHPLSHW